MARAQKGDFISHPVISGETDIDTREVLAVHTVPGGLTLDGGISYKCREEYYLTEYERGNFDLVSEHEVRKVYKGR